MAIQTRPELRQQILEAFKLEELDILCADLGVDPESIPGRSNAKPYYVDQLIAYFQARGQLPALLTALAAARPNLEWAYSQAAGDPRPAAEPWRPPLNKRTIGVAVALIVLGLAVFLVVRLASSLGVGSSPVTVTEAQAMSGDVLGRVESLRVEGGCVVLLSQPQRDDDQLRICKDTPAIPAAWQTKTIRIGADCASRAASNIHVAVYANPDYEDMNWEYQFSC